MNRMKKNTVNGIEEKQKQNKTKIQRKGEKRRYKTRGDIDTK